MSASKIIAEAPAPRPLPTSYQVKLVQFFGPAFWIISIHSLVKALHCGLFTADLSLPFSTVKSEPP